MSTTTTGELRPERMEARLLNFRMLPSEMDRVRERAAAEGRTVSDLVRSVLRSYLAQPPKSKPR